MNAPVLFLLSHSAPGGALELWRDLADGFRDRGNVAVLAALYPDRDPGEAGGIKVHYAVDRRPSGPIGHLSLFRALVRLLRTLRPSTVFTALPAANVLLPLAAAASGTRCRVVPSHHSPASTHRPMLNRLDRFTGSLPTVHRIVSVSRSVEESLGDRGPTYRARSITVLNALPPAVRSELEGRAKARTARRVERRTLIATGRLAEQKNYPTLIRAMASIPDATLDIVGSGPDERELKQLALETGVSDRVRFHGQMTRAQTLDRLERGEIFAQVSLFEGRSLGLLEAATLGLPLIVSDVPTQVEAVTSPQGELCGTIVPVHDHEALASAIRHLLDDPVAYSAASEAAFRLSSAFSFDDMLRSYLSLAGLPAS